MLARVFSGATVGLESLVVEVEVDVSSRGLPSFSMVGLPSQAVKTVGLVGFSHPNQLISLLWFV